MGRRRRSRAQRNPTQAGSTRLPPLRPGDAASESTGEVPLLPHEKAVQPRRLAARTCGWCGRPIKVKDTGRLPKWCSPSCRQRAWEQSRAAASGLSAIRVVERRVQVREPVAPTRRDWARLLHDLVTQLDDGRIYDRDLLALSVALNAVLDAYSRRPYVRSATDSGARRSPDRQDLAGDVQE
jgi:hypothetical protein